MNRHILLSVITICTLSECRDNALNAEVIPASAKSLHLKMNLQNYGVISWGLVSNANQSNSITPMYQISFVPESGFNSLRSLFASQVGVKPHRIHILAASGSYIQNEADLQKYVEWCVQQKTPLRFVVKVI